MGNEHPLRERPRQDNFEEIRNPLYNPGYDYISKAEFVPTGPGELRLKKGEKVRVIRQSVDKSCLYIERLNEVK